MAGPSLGAYVRQVIAAPSVPTVPAGPSRTTVWVLGDQLDPDRGAVGRARPGVDRVLLVESDAKLDGARWHVQRAHLVLTGMRRLAATLRERGLEVDHRQARSLAAGLAAHQEQVTATDGAPARVVAMRPASYDGEVLLERLGVHLVPNDQFLCDRDTFAHWAGDRRRTTLEDFYRWQRRRLGYLMDGDEPAGGRWNYDHDNREPPPRDPVSWPVPPTTPLDAVDEGVLADLRRRSPGTWGAEPDGTWPTSRPEALRRLDHAITHVLPRFGPHEDAMLSTSWHLAHTLLSPALNLGLLHPAEVADRVEQAYRSGAVPIASAEGLMRQVIGWREYVWGVYWRFGPAYREVDELAARRPLPPVYTGAPTRMACVRHVLQDVHDHGWTHHIPRLMVLANLSLLAGVRGQDLVRWMWHGFVDGAEWVMLPNVLGMALHADGGLMATKPYAAGGAYIDRMSDFCGGCSFDRTARTGPDACPFTTLYWDFFDRHRERFARHPRTAQQVRGLDRLADLPAVRERAREVLELLDAGLL